MTADQIATIRSTWSLIGATTDSVAPLFYDRLFTNAPELRALFIHADIASQGEKLRQTIAVVVHSLDDLSRILPAVEALGRRHGGYGVRDEHYAIVATALLDTFADVLGDAFSEPARESWTLALNTLAGVMQHATHRVDIPVVS